METQTIQIRGDNVNMKSNKEFNPYKAADIIKEQLKANDVIIRSWQEMSETAYNSCDNE